MRVLQLLTGTGFFGAESMALQLSVGLRLIGVEVIVGVFDHGGGRSDDLVRRFRDAGLRVHLLPCSGRIDLGLPGRIRAAQRELGADVLHSHKYKTTAYSLLAAVGGRTPVVATYHNWLPETKALRIYGRIDKHVAKYCHACIAVSLPVADELERFVVAERVVTIPNGIDVDAWNSAAGEARSRPGSWVVGFVGRPSEAKGLHLLLDAVAAIPEIDGRKVELLVVGDGPERPTFEARAGKADLAGRVTFAGAVFDVRSAYLRMDVLALPSRYEAFPMVILEAMAMRLPVIASDVGDVSKLVVTGETGVLLEANSAAAVAAALRALLADPARRAAYGENARRLVAARHSATAMARNYLEVYERVTARC
jgi:glycosyltransferase involved in cell wall biosynthesis